MGSFINRKKEKIQSVFLKLGTEVDEDSFIKFFKEMYPEDWLKINQKWFDEEQHTLPGKRHPMQHPDIYMKEMYRNHKDQYPFREIEKNKLGKTKY